MEKCSATKEKGKTMRLIDADALEKAIYEWMPKDQSTWMDSDLPPIDNLVVSIMMTIQEQPAIDAVTVVRCKDCRWWSEMQNSAGACLRLCAIDGALWMGTDATDFCSFAERKDDD